MVQLIRILSWVCPDSLKKSKCSQTSSRNSKTLIADSGLLCMLNWRFSLRYCHGYTSPPNRQRSPGGVFCFVVPQLSEENTMCWGKKWGLIWPHTAIYQSSSSDHKSHLWTAGVCQAMADMASVFFGDPTPTCSFDPNLQHKDTEEHKAHLQVLFLLRALWGH